VGVAVAKKVGTRVGRTHGASHWRSVSPVRDRQVEVGARLIPAAPWWPDVERKTFWSRFTHDREMIPFKVLLLTSLLMLAALLESVA
jgi:hypothetical protein